MSETQKQAIEKKSNASVATMFEADSFAGLKNVKSESVALPILKLLQNGSGEAQKRNENYVEGAEPGMFYNTVTKKLYDGEKGIEVIPVYYKMSYPEWAPFEKAEGRPIHPDRGPEVMSQTKQDSRNKDLLPNGNEIIKTANHFVVVLGDRPEKALMTMKTTQLKTSRQWNSLIENEFETDPSTGKSVPAPRFSRIYKLTSVENSGSFTWHGYSVNLLRKVDNTSLYQMAREFYGSLKRSQVNAESSPQEESNY